MTRYFPNFRRTDEPVLVAVVAMLALFAWHDSDLVLHDGLVPALGVAGYALWRWRR